MSKTKNRSRVLALVIMLALVLAVLPMGAMATGSYSSIVAKNLTMQFGDPTAANDPVSPEQDISLALDPNDDSVVIVTYSGIANYYPDTLAFYVTNNENLISSFSTDGGVTAQPTEVVNGELQPTNNVNSGFYILTVNTVNNGTTNITRTLTITKTNAEEVTLQFTIPPIEDADDEFGVMAYLPAAGQFTNEGVTTGGWGDAFTSSGALKAFKNSYSATGISLGAFGGYAVFDFGSPAKDEDDVVISGIFNDEENEYGVDFIVYGNSLGSNAEPGCIQVGVDNNSGGIDWYDIAGNLHYKSDTIWDYEVTYENYFPSDDALTPAANNLGQYSHGSDYTFKYHTIGGVYGAEVTGSGTVNNNPFHRHNWFPLYCNYFVARNGQTAALAKYGMFPFADYSPYQNNTAATVTLRGVKLYSLTYIPNNNGNPIIDTRPDTFLFGYADCHKNGNTISGSQVVNPYLTGRTEGGDPIDISWAVDAYGKPVNLPAIRYVRVYTGQQLVNGINGECSTEVTGIYRATSTGTGDVTDVSSATFSITGVTNPELSTTAAGIHTYTVTANTDITVSYTSSGNKVFVNENAGTGSATLTVNLAPNVTRIVRVIVHDGTTGLPYIGYVKLIGNTGGGGGGDK